MGSLDTPVLCVPPYLLCGKWKTVWCWEGGRCRGDNGKNISSSSPVLADGLTAMRCGLHIRTATTSTAGQRRSRGCGRGEDRNSLCVRGAEGSGSITVRQEAQRQRQRQQTAAPSWTGLDRFTRVRAGQSGGGRRAVPFLSALTGKVTVRARVCDLAMKTNTHARETKVWIIKAKRKRD